VTYFIVLAAVISREAGDGTRLGDQAFKVFIKHGKGERLGCEFAVDFTAIGICGAFGVPSVVLVETD